MIYLSAAAFALGLLAWDFGRRWLSTANAEIQRRAVNDVHAAHLREVRADLARLTDEHGEAIDSLREKYGDLGTQLNLRVRELSERGDEHRNRMDGMSASITNLVDSTEELFADVQGLEERPAEPVDVAEFKAELAELQAKYDTQHAAFANFWVKIGQQFVGKEELATELAKLKSGQAVLAATNNGARYRAGRTS